MSRKSYHDETLRIAIDRRILEPRRAWFGILLRMAHQFGHRGSRASRNPNIVCSCNTFRSIGDSERPVGVGADTSSYRPTCRKCIIDVADGRHLLGAGSTVSRSETYIIRPRIVGRVGEILGFQFPHAHIHRIVEACGSL